MPVKYRCFTGPIQQEFMTYNCGNCVECSTQRKRDYTVRNFAETCYTLADGGFVLVDTLTYNSYHVPYIDIDCPDVSFSSSEKKHLNFLSNGKLRVYCYRYNDVSKFFKRLRFYLCNYLREKYGYNHTEEAGDFLDKQVYGHLRYMCVGELGKVHGRVHYHLSLYCSVPDVTPALLKLYLDKAWRHLNNKSNYSVSKRFNVYSMLDFGATESNCRVDYNTIKSPSETAHIKYQIKYVLKDSFYERLLCKIFQVERTSELPKSLKSRVKLSIGFGAQLVDDYRGLFDSFSDTIKVDIDNELVYLPYTLQDGHNIVGNKAAFPLPQYAKNKLYKYTVRQSDGTYAQRTNAYGLRKKIENYNKSMCRLTEQITTHVASLSSSRQQEWKNILGSEYNVTDVAQYKLLFFGKLVAMNVWDGSIEHYYELQCQPKHRRLFKQHSDARSFSVGYRDAFYTDYFNDVLDSACKFLIDTKSEYSAKKQHDYEEKISAQQHIRILYGLEKKCV